MRIVSLVPSWTETLIELGAQVVGRTRYCVHPKGKVNSIPIVGGTKKVDWEALNALKPDLVLMDREENTKEMAEACSFAVHDTHITQVGDVGHELEKLSRKMPNLDFQPLIHRWSRIDEAKTASVSIDQFPGLIQWLRPPSQSIESFVYVIWKDPWMAVSRETFIGSVCDKLGIHLLPFSTNEKYPPFKLSQIDPQKQSLLLSSEPYDFEKRFSLSDLPAGVSAAFVDGEKFSWFGLRSAVFLEEQLGLKPESPLPQ